MHRHTWDHRPERTFRAKVDRQAISSAGHLLMAGVWLEHRLMRVPRSGLRCAETQGRRALSTLVVRTNNVQVDPNASEEM